MRSPARYEGLTLIARQGLAWRWIRHAILITRAGAAVRVERWEAACRSCAQPMTAHAPLPGGLRQQYLERRVRAREARKPVDVRLSVPTARPIKAFQLRSCATCSTKR